MITGFLMGSVQDLQFTRQTVPLGCSLVVGYLINLHPHFPEIVEALGGVVPTIAVWVSGPLVGSYVGVRIAQSRQQNNRVAESKSDLV